MAEISKIKLPSGNTYDIKDATARDMIAGGISYNVCWDGASVPVVANIPAGVVVSYNGTNYTGTKAASTAAAGTFYLIKSGTSPNAYDEYVAATVGSTKVWERLGGKDIDLSNLRALAYKDNVTLSKGSGDQVLGEGTTFQAASSAVSFAAHTKDQALGRDATFQTVVTPTVTKVKATASGAAVGADGTDEFVKSYPGATSKMVTTTVPNVTGNADVTIPNVTDNTEVTANKSNWGFAMGSGDDAETLIISGGNGSDVKASKVTLGTSLVASKVTLGTEKTVATGALDANGGGSPVMTGLGTPTKASAITGVRVTAQPTIALAGGAAAGTGVIDVVTGIASAETTTDDKDEVSAITDLGAATAAAQQITVGTNDKVKVAKYDDLGVAVS